MYSDALRMMDRNMERYMCEEMQEELRAKQQELDSKIQELDSLKEASSQKDALIAQLQAELVAKK